MPEQLSPGLVVCMALGMVVLINAGLLLALAGGGLSRQIRLIQRAVRSARAPWSAERQATDELHRRVGRLRSAQAASADPQVGGQQDHEPAGAAAAPSQSTADPPLLESPRAD